MKISFVVTFLLILNSVWSQNQLFEAYSARDFEKCIKLAKANLKSNPEDKTAHFFKGSSHNNLKQYKSAETHLLKAEKLGHTPIMAVWAHLIRSYAGQEKTDLLFQKLEEISNQGFSALVVLGLGEFDYLASNTEFLTLKNKVEANAFPCRQDPNTTKLSFWIGNWDVYANGRKIATSKISYSNGDCAVLENYQTLGAIAGNSLSHYDSYEKKWKQTYADAAGRVSYYVEADAPYEGDLQFISKATAQGGQLLDTPWIRMTYFKNEDGSVRQFMESSADKGELWTPIFDGLYKKNNEKE